MKDHVKKRKFIKHNTLIFNFNETDDNFSPLQDRHSDKPLERDFS